MDRQIIAQKLESLRRCVTRIEAKCPHEAATLAADADAQDIVALNLTRAVQLCVDIAAHLIASRELSPPDTMGAAFTALADAGLIETGLAERMRKAVGFRNIAVHNYHAIDWQIVHAICHSHLDDFRRYALRISELESL